MKKQYIITILILFLSLFSESLADINQTHYSNTGAFSRIVRVINASTKIIAKGIKVIANISLHPVQTTQLITSIPITGAIEILDENNDRYIAKDNNKSLVSIPQFEIEQSIVDARGKTIIKIIKSNTKPTGDLYLFQAYIPKNSPRIYNLKILESKNKRKLNYSTDDSSKTTIEKYRLIAYPLSVKRIVDTPQKPPPLPPPSPKHVSLPPIPRTIHHPGKISSDSTFQTREITSSNNIEALTQSIQKLSTTISNLNAKKCYIRAYW